MYLIWPRYAVSAETGYVIPYTGKLYYNLVHKRDQTANKFYHCLYRFGAEVGFIVISIAALIESCVHLIFGILGAGFSSDEEIERRVAIFSCSILTSFYALYSVIINLFVINLKRYIFHFDLFIRPYAHQGMFLDACKLGNIEAAKKFQELGVDSHQKNAFGITPALYAHIYGQEKLEKMFPLNNYEQEYLETKLLSHWLNIPGEVTLNNLKLDLQGAVSNWMFYSIAQALNHFRHNRNLRGFSLSPDKAEEIEKAFLNAYHPRSSSKIAQQIRTRQLTLIDSGWDEHAVCLVFYKGYLAICNRGEGIENFSTIEVFCIDPKLMTEQIIENIKTFSSKDTGTGMAYLYHALPGLLSPNGDPVQDAFCLSFKEVAPDVAKMGNCSLTSKKAALRFTWIMQLADLKRGEKESKLFTDWAGFHYLQTINPPDKFHGMDLREDFISQARQTAVKKKKRYDKNLKLLKI